MLKSKKYEVLNQVCKIYSAILNQTNHHIKTALGVSKKIIVTQQETHTLERDKNQIQDQQKVIGVLLTYQ